MVFGYAKLGLQDRGPPSRYWSKLLGLLEKPFDLIVFSFSRTILLLGGLDCSWSGIERNSRTHKVGLFLFAFQLDTTRMRCTELGILFLAYIASAEPSAKVAINNGLSNLNPGRFATTRAWSLQPHSQSLLLVQACRTGLPQLLSVWELAALVD